MADASVRRQAWTSLLSNGNKFIQPRAVAHIEVDSVAKGSEIIYRVRDEGVGFDPAYEHKPLDVIRRLHGVDAFEGTGIAGS